MATYTKQPSGKDNYLWSLEWEGKDDTNYGSSANLEIHDKLTDKRRPILEFDITDLPSGDITSAKLKLYYHYYYAPYTDPVGKTTYAYKLTRTDWVETESTWNIYKTGSSWTTPGGDYVTSNPSGGSDDFPAAFGWMEWDVKNIVEDAIENASSIVELLVRFASESGTSDPELSMARFHSNNYTGDTSLCPKLVIEYTPALLKIDTKLATNIQENSATLNGEITQLSGGGNADERGFVYATTSYDNPEDTAPSASEYNDNGGYVVNETDSFPVEAYDLPLTGLTAGTKYYVRSYAHNTLGYAYGDEILFGTSGWLAGWAKRIDVTIDSDLIDTDLGHFRITLMLDSSTGKTNKDVTCIFDELGSNANRKKIAVTDSGGGNQLYVEIERWDNLREKAVLHVSRAGWIVLAASDIDLFIYYDSAKADNTDYVSDSSNPSVWDSNYKIANHMATYNYTEYKDTDGVYTDSVESAMVLEPTIIKDGAEWHMWVNIFGASPHRGIDYITSSDGEVWSRQGEVPGLDLDCPEVYLNTDNDGFPISGALADDGGVQTDETTEANSGTANDMTLLPAAPVVGDNYKFCGKGDYHQIILNVGTAGEGNYTITWEFWDSDSWEALADVVDNTNGFKTTGINTVSWTVPSTFASSTIESITGYWIRARLSAYTPNGYIQPKGTQVWAVYKFWLTGGPYYAPPNSYKDDVDLYVASSGLKFGLYKEDWLPRGSLGQWNDTLFGNRWMWKEGSIFYILHESGTGSTSWQLGLATSSDGLTLEQDADNPIGLWGGPTVIKIGNTYYLSMHHAGIYSSTDKESYVPVAGKSNPLIYRTLTAELEGSWPEIDDPTVLEAGGTTYYYYTAGLLFVNLVKIPVTASECIANYPVSIIDASSGNDIIGSIWDSDGESAQSDNAHARGRKGADGIAGTAMQFVGTGAIDLPQKSIVGNATFLARIKLDTLGKTNYIITNELRGTSWPNYRFEITSANKPSLRFYKDGDTSQVVTGDTILPADTWYTITGTYDGSKLKIYVNDTLDKEENRSGTPNNPDEYFRVGAVKYDTGQSSVYLEAILDELIILDVAESAAWVKATHHNLNNSLLTYGSEEDIPFLSVVVATSTSEALTPTVETGVEILAVTAEATSQAPAPIFPHVEISAPIAIATSEALVPTLPNATILGVTATADSEAKVPVIRISYNVAAEVAASDSQAIAPTVELGVNLSPPTATSTSEALVPVITISDVTITAVVALADSEALVPTITAATNVTITVATATADGAALTPTITTTWTVDIVAPVATADSEALAPAISCGVNITAPVAQATSEALIPEILLAGDAFVLAVTATADSQAIAPTIELLTEILAVTATADSQAHAAAIVTTWSIEVLAVTALADSQALAVAILAQKNVTILAVTALADSLALPSIYTGRDLIGLTFTRPYYDALSFTRKVWDAKTFTK